MQSIFSIEEALKFGWEKTKVHSALLFQALLTVFGLYVLQMIVTQVLGKTFTGAAAGFLISIAGLVVSTGLTVITLKIARGEHAVYRDLIPSAKLVWFVLLASLLTGILVFAGLILLVVPGVYFMLRFSMVRYAILDGSGVMEAFEKSSKLTNGHKWQLLGFFIVITIANVIGALLFVVGLLITVPVTFIAYAHVYQKLMGHASAAQVERDHEHHNHDGHTHDHAE